MLRGIARREAAILVAAVAKITASAPFRNMITPGGFRMSVAMTNSMKQKLAAGELVPCMNLRLARSVDIAMVAKAGGYDALYVDMEHSPYSIDTAATICAAAIGIGITPLVRVPSHDAHWSSRVLDGGAQGVIVPHSTTAERPRRSCAIAGSRLSASAR